MELPRVLEIMRAYPRTGFAVQGPRGRPQQALSRRH